MNVWSIRHQGSPDPVDGISAEEIVDGVKEGIWDPTDEVMGPNDPDWVSLEEHPVFAQAMADYEPPPPKHYPDETKLDMNPLIDVALVLLIFFMLTTTYEQMRREFEPAKGVRDNKKGSVTEPQLKSLAVRVSCTLENDKPVYRVENEVVPEAELEAKFKEFKEKTGNNKLAMEIEPQVPWRAVVAIQDAASGAKFEEIIRVMRSPKE